jgi:hypothetical protein
MQTPSPDDTGTRGRDAPIGELKVINLPRAPTRFRAFPDDTGIALNGDKPVARVGPILKLLDGDVIVGQRVPSRTQLPAGCVALEEQAESALCSQETQRLGGFRRLGRRSECRRHRTGILRCWLAGPEARGGCSRGCHRSVPFAAVRPEGFGTGFFTPPTPKRFELRR